MRSPFIGTEAWPPLARLSSRAPLSDRHPASAPPNNNCHYNYPPSSCSSSSRSTDRTTHGTELMRIPLRGQQHIYLIRQFSVVVVVVVVLSLGRPLAFRCRLRVDHRPANNRLRRLRRRRTIFGHGRIWAAQVSLTLWR